MWASYLVLPLSEVETKWGLVHAGLGSLSYGATFWGIITHGHNASLLWEVLISLFWILFFFWNISKAKLFV